MGGQQAAAAAAAQTEARAVVSGRRRTCRAALSPWALAPRVSGGHHVEVAARVPHRRLHISSRRTSSPPRSQNVSTPRRSSMMQPLLTSGAAEPQNLARGRSPSPSSMTSARDPTDRTEPASAGPPPADAVGPSLDAVASSHAGGPSTISLVIWIDSRASSIFDRGPMRSPSELTPSASTAAAPRARQPEVSVRVHELASPP